MLAYSFTYQKEAHSPISFIRRELQRESRIIPRQLGNKLSFPFVFGIFCQNPKKALKLERLITYIDLRSFSKFLRELLLIREDKLAKAHILLCNNFAGNISKFSKMNRAAD
jgi:hypothetical protein